MAATQKINFLTLFPIHSFRQFLARTYRFATIQNDTDNRRQTDDRQHSVPKVRPIVWSVNDEQLPCFMYQLVFYMCPYFLADRTIGRAFGTLCHPSVCLSVCDVLYCGEMVRTS